MAPPDAPPPTRILVADDEPDLLTVMTAALQGAGFSVETADDGAAALAAIRANPPDIAVLDLTMPRMTGFEVTKALRADPLLEHLPIIILSAQTGGATKVEGLNLGADDFITKPVDRAELLARINMIVRRSRMGLDANPLTHLPGNVSIERRVEAALEAGLPVAVLYLDLNQFKAYNDAYGYEAGDEVIRATSRLLVKAAQELIPPAFVGHIGGDDFIMLTSPDRMKALAGRIIKDFDLAVPGFYKPEDAARGHIASHDRQGHRREYPLLSIAVGVCHNAVRPLTSAAQVSQLGAELKRHAKRHKGSAVVIDRRKT